MKRNISLFSLALLAGILFGGSLFSIRRQLKHPTDIRLLKISPENSIIVFDFHDVLVKRRYVSIARAYAQIAWNSPHRWQLLKLPLSSSYRKEFKKLKRELGSGDLAHEELAKKYPALQDHLYEIIDAYNDYSINKQVVEIIRALKAQGFAIYLASNIGPYSYKITRDKYPEVFYIDRDHQEKLFDGAFMIGKQDRFGNEFTRAQKPSVAFYHRFLQYLQYKNVSKKMNIVFIDDMQENIDGAHKADARFEGIRFTSSKDLKKILKLKGINV